MKPIKSLLFLECNEEVRKITAVLLNLYSRNPIEVESEIITLNRMRQIKADKAPRGIGMPGANGSVLAALAVLFAAASARAQSEDMVVSYEPAGVWNSPLSGTSVENFNNASLGMNNNLNWNGVGTINAIDVIPANQYGGVPTPGYPNGNNYPVIGPGFGTTTSTLTLNQNSSYFGMEWSAADQYNTVSFFNNGSLVASLNEASVFKQIPSGWPSPYGGNPNPAFLGQDYGEQFAFINFLGAPGTSWNQIVISNNGYTGFESSDWTSRVNAWNPLTDGTLPGTPAVQVLNGITSQITSLPSDFGAGAAPGAPAPPMGACLAFAAVLVLQALRSRKKSVHKILRKYRDTV